MAYVCGMSCVALQKDRRELTAQYRHVQKQLERVHTENECVFFASYRFSRCRCIALMD